MCIGRIDVYKWSDFQTVLMGSVFLILRCGLFENHLTHTVCRRGERFADRCLPRPTRRPLLILKLPSRSGSLISPFQPMVVRGFSKYTCVSRNNRKMPTEKIFAESVCPQIKFCENCVSAAIVMSACKIVSRNRVYRQKKGVSAGQRASTPCEWREHFNPIHYARAANIFTVMCDTLRNYPYKYPSTYSWQHTHLISPCTSTDTVQTIHTGTIWRHYIIVPRMH